MKLSTMYSCYNVKWSEILHFLSSEKGALFKGEGHENRHPILQETQTGHTQKQQFSHWQDENQAKKGNESHSLPIW